MEKFMRILGLLCSLVGLSLASSIPLDYYPTGPHPPWPPVIARRSTTTTTPTPPPPPKPQGGHAEQILELFNVQTDIRYRFATTRIVSLVRNAGSVAGEMSFDVTLPKEAFIVSFAMTVDGKVYDGDVKEKKEAKQQYDRAVSRGQSAGIIQQTPRHSNRFDVSVNVESGKTVNFTLIYQEVLKRKWGRYEYETHLKPGQAVENFNLEVFIQENRPLQFVKTPKIRTSSEITNDVEELNDLTIIERPSTNSAHIVYKPSLKQQGPDGLAARFVLQYDVEHAHNGDLLVVDGYFLHLFAPKASAQPMPKDIIFVLDVSGSMTGTKIRQLKVAMKVILGDLHPKDRFNILSFNSVVNRWRQRLTTATPDAIEEAYHFVRSMRANGGTNINEALLEGLEILQGRELMSRVGMIFFLTDGEPTVGETVNEKIAQNVRGKNVDTAIFSLAFGTGADFASLKTISTQNSGFARKIYEAADASLQVASLYKEISTVAMKNVSVEYLPGITKTTDKAFPIVFNGSEIIICGRIGEVQKGDVFVATLGGLQGDGPADIELEIDDIDDVTITLTDSQNSFFSMPRDYTGIIEKMWAFLTIKQLLMEKDRVIENKAMVADLEKKILEMSLKYKFVTPLTSMVVTKPEKSDIEDKGPITPTLYDLDRPNIGRGHVNLMPSLSHNTAMMVPQYFAPNRGMPSGAYGPIRHSSMKSMGPRAGRPNYATRMRPSRRRKISHTRLSLATKTAATSTTTTTTARIPTTTTTAHIPTTTTTTPISTSTTQSPSTTISKRLGGGQRGPRPGKKLPMVLLQTITIKSEQMGLCMVPRKWPAGDYVLVTNGGDFAIELNTACLRKKSRCKFTSPRAITLKSGGQTSRVVLPFSPQQVQKELMHNQTSDVLFSARFSMKGKRDQRMVVDHDLVRLTVEQRRHRRKMLLSVELEVKQQNSLSGMTAAPKGRFKDRKTSKKTSFQGMPEKECNDFYTFAGEKGI